MRTRVQSLHRVLPAVLLLPPVLGVAQVDTAGRRRRRRDDRAIGDLVAPMPGVVIQVLVEAGDVVEEDQILAVLESMKMQMQIRAPFAGRVKRVNALAGAQVEKGMLLVQIDE